MFHNPDTLLFPQSFIIFIAIDREAKAPFIVPPQVEGKCGQHFTGPTGITGIRGEPGERGAPGSRGRKGEKGSKGFSYIVEPYPLFGPKGEKGQQGSSRCFR